MVMKAALSRLQKLGLAPKNAKALDYETAVTPGNSTGAGLFLITDEALYFGLHNSLSGHHRIEFSDIGKTKVERLGNSATYSLYRIDSQLLVSLYVQSAKPSFIEKFQLLGRQ
jgi:hypothetical protein